MASAARRAHESGSANAGPGSGGADEVGERRLVARATADRGARPTDPPAPHGPTTPARLDGVPMPPGRPPGRTETRAATRIGIAEWLAGWRLDTRRIRPILAVGVAALILAAGVVVGLTLRSPSRAPLGAARLPSRARGVTGSSTGRSDGATPGPAGKHVHRQRGASASTTTSPSTPTKPPAISTARGTPGGPRLASASPSGGRAGDSVVIDGTGLFSSDGQVVAYFGGSAAPTSCSSQSACTATVPDLGARPSTVDLTVVTANGRSNGLRFSYQ